MSASINIRNQWHDNPRHAKVLFLLGCSIYLTELIQASTDGNMPEFTFGITVFLIIIYFTLIHHSDMV